MIEVQPVRTRAQLREFLRLPTWDPRARTHSVPLWHRSVQQWWAGRGPHRRHGPVELYLARDRAGRVRGRTTLHTDARMDAKLGERTLLLGATEFADREALAALVGYAVAQAQARGRTRLLGPVSLLPNQVGGVVTSGFEEPGFVDGPWNPEHYPADWEALGFERSWTGATWRCEDLGQLDPRTVFPVDELPEGVTLRHGRRRQLADQLPVLRQMLNAAFAELGYYTQIEADELEAATDGLAHLLDERLLLWLERDGEPLAFVLVVPDLTDFIRSTEGRLSPLDMVRLLATRGRYRRDAVLIIKGTVPGARGQGLMRHLSRQLLTGLQDGGYRRLSVTFIEDDNHGSQSQFAAMGGRPLHQTCFYTRTVPTAGDEADVVGAEGDLPGDEGERTASTEVAPASPAARLLARAADWGRAPSAHNTQPWRVRPLDGSTLAVGWHAHRELVDADPPRRDLMLSLGALGLALRVVAHDLGLRAQVRWAVDPARHEAATVALESWEVVHPDGAQDPSLPWTVDDLQARRTSRDPYRSQPTVAEVEALGSATRAPDPQGRPTLAPYAGDLVVLPQDLVDRLLPRATARTLTGPAAEELQTWLRLRPSHARHDLDGLSAEALRLSVWEARGLWALTSTRLVRGVLATTRVDRLVARLSQARPPGAVVALCAPPGLDLDALGAMGERLLAIWLAGQRAGWSAHPLSELIDDPDTAAALHEHVSLALDRPSTVYALWRWGRPDTDPPRSPRLTDR